MEPRREVEQRGLHAHTTRIVSKLMRQDTPGANPQGRTPFEKDLYFFHPDHLGSSSFVTDTNGKVYEHLEYFPFGEAWVEESSNTQRAPYLFTAKELDEETGLYYFGARYYDPRTSVWQSADPILGKYLPSARGDSANLAGMGGVYNSLNLNLYSYGHLNAVKYSDPDGKEVYIGGHVAAAPLGQLTSPQSYHLAIILIPNRPQDFTNRTGWRTTSTGHIHATLGGQPGPLLGLSNLRSAPNYPEDDLTNLNFMQRVETPEGMTDTQFINSLIEAAGSYQNHLNYDIIPEPTGDSYNSNSYVSGVLRAAGAEPPSLNTGGLFQAPGYEKPIPIGGSPPFNPTTIPPPDLCGSFGCAP